MLEPGQQEGRYRDGFAGYGVVLRAIGETRHQSCLAVTSREAPPELDQHLVARLVSVGVVDALEAIHVEQQEAGRGGEGAGERHALLLPSRELRRVLLALIG